MANDFRSTDQYEIVPAAPAEAARVTLIELWEMVHRAPGLACLQTERRQQPGSAKD